MILVVGATGLVGSEVCRRLAARGEPTRALVRTTSDPAKVEPLRSAGVELSFGDLKDPDSLAKACRGVTAIVSTASSTFSRQDGDSILSVDQQGQLHLVQAAKDAGIDRFVFVSFRRPPGLSFPLGDAKASVESAVAGMNYTVIQASYFMEVWLSPALGFDPVGATARASGAGDAPISWVSYADVAQMCALAIGNPKTERRVIEFGGPQALSLLEVVSIFEQIGGRRFTLEHLAVEALMAQFQAATDPMQKSFAALMLGPAFGDAMEMDPVIDEFGLKLLSVQAYARRVLGAATV